MKLMSPDEAVSVLLPKISKAKGRLTVSDASAASGLAIEDARTGLEVLMNRYVCRLQVTDTGEVLYDFGTAMRRRGEKTAKEILHDIGDALWRVFTVFFKIWIAVTLVVYFVVFVIILLAIILGSRGRDSDDGIDLHGIGDLFGDLFSFGGNVWITSWAVDPYGYRHRRYQQPTRRDPRKSETKKRFVQSVYDFVFGPVRPAFDPFANEREVVAWLRANKGILTTTEIVALAGWTYDESEERMADYLTRFRGAADITDDGVLIGRFDEVLQRGDAGLDGGSVELFWDEYEAPYVATGNTSGRNTFITVMNGFNLLFSWLVLFSPKMHEILGELLADFASMTTVTFFLGWLPFVFSALFFIVPMARVIVVRRRERDRIARNKRRRIIRAIFQKAGSDLTITDLRAAVNAAGLEPLQDDDLQRLFERVLVEMQGRSDLTDEGGTVYRFPRIRREVETARRIRSTVSPAASTGTVIFDTGA